MNWTFVSIVGLFSHWTKLKYMMYAAVVKETDRHASHRALETIPRASERYLRPWTEEASRYSLSNIAITCVAVAY